MKRIFKSFAVLLTGIIVFSCSSEEELHGNTANSDSKKRIEIIADDFSPSDITRTEYTEMADGNGYSFKWTDGDVLGIFPQQDGYQIAFPISDGQGTNTAVFDGGDWALKPNTSYAAYYPLVNKLSIDKTSIPVSYLGQTQDGNGDTRHLSKYDFMASAFAQVDANGNVSLKLKHLSSLVQFKLTMPQADTFTKIEIESDNASFITEGTFDLTDSNPIVNATNTSKSFIINLKNVSTTSDNEVITINAMLAPVDFSSSTFTASVYGSNSEYIFSITGKNLAKGNAYNDWNVVDYSGVLIGINSWDIDEKDYGGTLN